MTQNIYDNPEFFQGYCQLPRSVRGLVGAPEWASLRALTPPLEGMKVIDLGCGFGSFCRWAREQGAASVLGVDVSENMLARARAMTNDAAVTYARTDLEALDLPPGSFELAFSSLVLHYVENLAGLLGVLHRALVPNARLIVSMEHPIFTAPSRPGWSVGTDGRKTWPLDGYQIEGPRTTDWLARGVVKHHRALGTILNTLIRSGFSISRVEDWTPSDEQVQATPDLVDERQRPMFLFIAAQRSA